MSPENITKYNGTSFYRNKNEAGGIGFFEALLLTLCVISSVVLVSSLVWYMIRKRALRKMRHHLVPLYHFDPGECEDWEDKILEDSKRGRARNRPQISELSNYDNWTLKNIGFYTLIFFNWQPLTFVKFFLAIYLFFKRQMKKLIINKPFCYKARCLLIFHFSFVMLDILSQKPDESFKFFSPQENSLQGCNMILNTVKKLFGFSA